MRSVIYDPSAAKAGDWKFRTFHVVFSSFATIFVGICCSSGVGVKMKFQPGLHVFQCFQQLPGLEDKRLVTDIVFVEGMLNIGRTTYGHEALLARSWHESSSRCNRVTICGYCFLLWPCLVSINSPDVRYAARSRGTRDFLADFPLFSWVQWRFKAESEICDSMEHHPTIPPI